MRLPNYVTSTWTLVRRHRWTVLLGGLVVCGMYTCGLPHTPRSHPVPPQAQAQVLLQPQVAPRDTLALQVADLKKLTQMQQEQVATMLKELQETRSTAAA